MSEDKRIQLEDDPAFYWEMMCKNLARENHRLMERLVQLEDLNRWRNAHTEPPAIEGQYIVATCRNNIGSWSDNYWENGWWEINPVDYWRPIGPLPGEGGE
jgi:hypothetical protein